MICKHYDLIIFDCDGTLVDSEDINSRAVSEVLVSLGHGHYTPEYCRDVFTGMSLPNMLVHLSNEIGRLFQEEELTKQFVECGSILAYQHLQATPYAHDLIEQLPHKKCVASNGERSTVLESLKITRLNRFFLEHHVFTRSQVKEGKPAPDLFLFAAKEMGVEPHACLVIEDSPIGVRGAKAAGMTVLGFNGASHINTTMQQRLLNAKPDAVIGHLSEVLGYVEVGQ